MLNETLQRRECNESGHSDNVKDLQAKLEQEQLKKKPLILKIQFLESQVSELQENCSMLENDNTILKEKVRDLDNIQAIDFKNIMNQAPFSSFLEGDSADRRNAINSFVSDNFYEADKLSDGHCDRSIEVQDIVKFDQSHHESSGVKTPSLEQSFNLLEFGTPGATSESKKSNNLERASNENPESDCESPPQQEH